MPEIGCSVVSEKKVPVWSGRAVLLRSGDAVMHWRADRVAYTLQDDYSCLQYRLGAQSAAKYDNRVENEGPRGSASPVPGRGTARAICLSLTALISAAIHFTLLCPWCSQNAALWLLESTLSKSSCSNRTLGQTAERVFNGDRFGSLFFFLLSFGPPLNSFFYLSFSLSLSSLFLSFSSASVCIAPRFFLSFFFLCLPPSVSLRPCLCCSHLEPHTSHLAPRLVSEHSSFLPDTSMSNREPVSLHTPHLCQISSLTCHSQLHLSLSSPRRIQPTTLASSHSQDPTLIPLHRVAV